MKVHINADNDIGAAANDFDINPLDLAEHVMFKKRRAGPSDNYRKHALKMCFDSKVQFNSTCNSFWELAKPLLTATCPYCEKQMEAPVSQGGSSSTATLSLDCACGAKIKLTIPWDGINVTPPQIEPNEK